MLPGASRITSYWEYPGGLQRLKDNILRALPQNQPTQIIQVLATLDDRQKMIAGKRADFGGKAGAAIDQQDLRFADAAWIEQHIAP